MGVYQPCLLRDSAFERVLGVLEQYIILITLENYINYI